MSSDQSYTLEQTLNRNLISLWRDFRRLHGGLSVLKISDANLDFSNFRSAIWGKTELLDLSNCEFVNCKIIGFYSEKYNITGASFTDCDINGSRFENSEKLKVRFKGCNFIQGSFNNWFFDSSRLPALNYCFFDKILFEYVEFQNGQLKKVHFRNCKFVESKFTRVTFIKTRFQVNKLSSIKFYEVKFHNDCSISQQSFEGVDISSIYFDTLIYGQIQLTGAILYLESSHNFNKGSGITIGINGLYNKKNGTLVLGHSDVKPDSMQGDNPTAIVESLKRARHFLNISLSMLAITYLLSVSTNTTDFAFQGVNIPIDKAQGLCLLIALGTTLMSSIFARDAQDGMYYIKSQVGAMMVGNFPWIISRYSKRHIGTKYLINFLLRICLSFHTLGIIYMLYDNWVFFDFSDFWIVILSLVALYVSIDLFIISEKFQKPILFETKDAEIDE